MNGDRGLSWCELEGYHRAPMPKEAYEVGDLGTGALHVQQHHLEQESIHRVGRGRGGRDGRFGHSPLLSLPPLLVEKTADRVCHSVLRCGGWW
jgi:hypothetical protein